MPSPDPRPPGYGVAMPTVHAPKPIALDGITVSVVTSNGRDRPDANGRWYWRARETGGARAYRWRGWATRDEARRLVMAILAKGDDALAHEAEVLVECRTLGDLLALWLAAMDRTMVSGETLHAWRAAAKHIARTIGSVPITACRDAALLHVKRRLEPKKGAPGASSTIRREVDMLRGAWKWGIDQELVTGPGPRTARITIPDTGPVYNHRTAEPDEVERIITALRARPRSSAVGWFALALRLSEATGARIGEVNALRGCDIDMRAGTVLLHGRLQVRKVMRRGKTGPREVPLPPELVDQLRPFLPPDPNQRIWPVTPGTFISQFHRQLADGCKLAGVPHTSSHGFRRAMDDRLAAAGPDILVRWMGHTIATAMKSYRKVQLDELRQAALARGVAGHTQDAGHSTGAQPARNAPGDPVKT